MPTLPLIKTASWATKLPDDNLRVGISRGTPRRLPAGYRVYRALAPGPWFNSVGIEEYYHLYRTEILGPLDPRLIADALLALGNGRVPVLLCYEQPDRGQWCHRAMAAEWLAEVLGATVPEFGYESLPQHEHPLMPPQLRRRLPSTEPGDVSPFVGRTATIAGELHRVVGPDPERPGSAIIAAGDRQFSTSMTTLRRQFAKP
jgi:hypothetical protein